MSIFDISVETVFSVKLRISDKLLSKFSLLGLFKKCNLSSSKSFGLVVHNEENATMKLSLKFFDINAYTIGLTQLNNVKVINSKLFFQV